MKFILNKIIKHKFKYLSISVIIGIVFYAIQVLYSISSAVWEDLNPDFAFNVEDVYEVKLLSKKQSLLGIKGNQKTLVQFDEVLIQELGNISGIKSACLSAGFTPVKKTYFASVLNDSIKNFNLYLLGKGFEKVLKVDGFNQGKQSSNYPKLYIETNLENKLKILGYKGDIIEVGKDKEKHQLAGTFKPVGVFSQRAGTLYTGLQIVEKSNRILIRFAHGVDVDELEQQISGLLKSKYNLERISYDFYPLGLYGMDNWFEMQNQIIAMLFVGFILLLYVMLALLGLYWNETKSRAIEIGLMRAVGFTKWQVLLLYLKEATFISLFSITIVSAILLHIYPNNLQNLLGFLTELFIEMIFVLLIVWVSILIPALKSSNIQPMEALSEE